MITYPWANINTSLAIVLMKVVQRGYWLMPWAGIGDALLSKPTSACIHAWMLWPWASYQIREIVGCAGNAENVFPHRFLRKPIVSYPGMHHGTCVTHVLWCMLESQNRGDGENVSGIPGAFATRNLTYLVRGPWILFQLTTSGWVQFMSTNCPWHYDQIKVKT